MFGVGDDQPVQPAVPGENKDEGGGGAAGGGGGGGGGGRVEVADVKDNALEEELMRLVATAEEDYTPQNLERIYALIDSNGIDLTYQVSPVNVHLSPFLSLLVPSCSLPLAHCLDYVSSSSPVQTQ